MITKMLTILIIHSLPPSFWTKDLQKGFQDELNLTGVSYKIESVHLPILGQEKIIERIEKEKPDIVLISNEPNVKDTKIIYDLMNLGIKTIFAGIPRKPREIPWIKKCWKKYQAGVMGTFQAAASIRFLIKIKKIKKISVLSTTNKTIENLANLIKKDVEKNLNIPVEIVVKDRIDLWKKSAISLNKRSDALFPLLPYGLKKTNGKIVNPEEWKYIGDFLKKHINIPTLAIGSMAVGAFDRLMGLVIEPSHIGMQAASLVYRHVRGTRFLDLPFERPMFHDLQIRKSEVDRLSIILPDDFFAFATIL